LTKKRQKSAKKATPADRKKAPEATQKSDANERQRKRSANASGASARSDAEADRKKALKIHE
jgi:hypothetical protein